MGSKGGVAVDHDQILAAVVVALGKSSSKVANYSCEDSSGEIDVCAARENNTHKLTTKSHKHSMFSCFAKSSSVKAVTTSRLPSWPKSPSHIMSRLLITPDMSPDRILVKSMPCSPGGDQSPARPSSRLSSSRSQFSSFKGSLTTTKSNKSKPSKSKTSKQDAGMDGLERELRDEPTSPKVTCMGTVKAPKKKKASSKSKECHPVITDLTSCRPPKWKKCQTLQNYQCSSQDYSGILELDLSRLGQKSGEVSRKSGEIIAPQSRRAYGKSLSNHFEQDRKDEEAVTSGRGYLCDRKKKSGPMRILTDSDQNVRALGKPLTFIHPDGLDMCTRALKRPEEICLWKRRCIPEPLKLDVATRS